MIIPGIPVPFARPRPHFKKPGVFIHPKRYREWLETARMIIPRAPVDGPVSVEVVAVFPRPKSWPKRIPMNIQWKDTMPDLDNLIKAGLDAGNGLLYKDDAQVVRCSGTKLYGPDRNTALMIHVAPIVTVSVPWGLSYSPCGCWQELTRK